MVSRYWALAFTLLATTRSGAQSCVLFDDQIHPLGEFPIYQTVGSAHDAAFNGTNLLVAEDTGLAVVDASDPTNLATLGSVATSHWAKFVAADGNLAYLAMNGVADNFAVVDVANPAAPAVLGYATTNEGDATTYTHGFAAVGDRVFLPDWSSNLAYLDVSNSSAPFQAGQVNFSGLSILAATDGTLVYGFWTTSLQTSCTMVVIDPTTTPPTQLGSVGFSHGVCAATCADGYVYALTWEDVGSASSLRLLRFDVSNPGAPVVDATIPVGTVGQSWSPDVQVMIDGNLAFVTADELAVYDISDPSTPQLLGALTQPWSGALCRAGDVLYGASQSVFPVDIHQESFLPPIASSSSYSTASSAVVDGGYAYVATPGGLEVVDITDPALPTVGSYLAAPAHRGYRKVGNTLYVMTDVSLLLLDVSDPTNPVFLGSASAHGVDLDVYGNHVVMVDGYGTGISVVDVSNPASPVVTDSHPFGGYTAVEQYNGRFFITAWDGTPPAELQVWGLQGGLLKIGSATPLPEPTSFMEVNGSMGYLVTSTEVRAWDFDITGYRVPPALVDSVALGFQSAGINIGSVALGGDQLYIGGSYDTFWVVDTSTGVPGVLASSSVGNVSWLGADDSHVCVGADGDLDVYPAQCGALAVGSPLPVQVSSFLRASPNPGRGQVAVTFARTVEGNARVEVFDVLGRLVAVLADGRLGRSGTLTWDARDSGGRLVAPGTYFVRMQSRGATRSAKITLVR